LLQTFGKLGRGPVKNSVSTAALVAAALFCSGIFDGAQAQFFPWNNGGWGGGGWDDRPRRVIRRIPRNVEDDGEKINSTLPKPTGPLVLVVSIGKQTVSVYDGTNKIATSPISSGMPGHDSPTGIFSILEKNRYHYSNLYGGAPMPYMERITNSGVAMHEGVVPGYPASHGCIRLPGAFARNLFGITEIGARVIITQDDLVPVEFSSPHLIAPLPPDEQASNATPVVTAEATTKDVPSVIGITTPAAAAEVPDKPRTRAQAAAARAAEKVQLSSAITDAENRKTAAIANAKATADAARAAKDAIQKARAEQERLKDAAEKAVRDAANGADKFKDFTAKLVKVEIDKLTKEDLDKQSADELAEETKVLDLGDAIAAAKKAAADQAPQIDKAIAASAEADKTAKAAAEAVKAAEKAIVDAKAALASANAIDERKDNPVSIFVSRKTGRLQAKLGLGDPVIDVPVTITNPNTPLGTHVYTAVGYTPGEKGMRWNVVTVNTAAAKERPYYRRRGRHEDEAYVAPAGDNADPANALERIQIPKDTADRLAELMKPGSSFIITDYGLSRETSKRTDFIIEPWRSSTAAPVEYEGGRVPD
jgi:lipoprotein-anchoring transpeptidase ErfK/SrfK